MSAPAEWHDLDLLTEADPPDAVTVTNLSDTHNALMVAGPRSRDVLSRVTDQPLDNGAFPWLSTREVAIAGITVQALRMSFTGELGWELHFPIDHSVAVYEALSAAGEPLGMVDFGLLATESMRLEKNYRAWKHDLHTEYTVLEAGLDRFVDLDKDFRGRDTIVAQRRSGDRRRFVALEVDNDEAAAHTGDPVWAGDDLIGVVTSGGYGHTMDVNIAMGYVDPEHAAVGTELAIDVIGVRSGAVVRAEPMFDPAHERPRA